MAGPKAVGLYKHGPWFLLRGPEGDQRSGLPHGTVLLCVQPFSHNFVTDHPGLTDSESLLGENWQMAERSRTIIICSPTSTCHCPS